MMKLRLKRNPVIGLNCYFKNITAYQSGSVTAISYASFELNMNVTISKTTLR